MKSTSQSSVAFAGSIPEVYDQYLGPFFFEDYAADLASRIDVPAEGRILETACGTGISTAHLRAAMAPTVEIVATDLSEPMLAVARQKRGQLENVRFEASDAASLGFEDGAFDAVCSQFGLMFVPDKVAAMKEAFRVLRPGGRMAFNVWDGLVTNPYVQITQTALADFFETDSPTFLYKPWSFSALDPLKDLMETAGFTDITLQMVARVNDRSTALQVATGLVTGTPTVVDVEERATAPADEIVNTVAEALARAFGPDPIAAPMQAIVVTGRRPLQ